MRDVAWWARRHAEGMEVPFHVFRKTFPYLQRMAKDLLFRTPFGQRVNASTGGFEDGIFKRPKKQSTIIFPKKKRTVGPAPMPSPTPTSNG